MKTQTEVESTILDARKAEREAARDEFDLVKEKDPKNTALIKEKDDALKKIDANEKQI